MPRILGIDLGLKRTGLAISDETGLTARALPVHKPKSRDEDVAFVLDLIKKHDVDTVVIGYALLPRSQDEGFMAKRARGFALVLGDAAGRQGVPLKVHLVEEAFTSEDANARLIEQGMSPRDRRLAIDGEVARMLVIDFAHTRGKV